MSSFSAQPIPAAPPSPSSSAAPTTSSATLTPSSATPTPSSATRTPSSAALTPSPATPSPSSAPPTPSSATPTPSDLASNPILATQSSKKKHKDDPVAPVVSVLATVRDQSKASPIRSKNLLLPVGRVRSIVRSSPEVEIIGKEFLFTVTKATELFIIYLTKLSQKKGNNQEINYTDVVDVVDRKACMEFLEDFVPKKIKFSEYLSIMEEENMAEEKICSSFY